MNTKIYALVNIAYHYEFGNYDQASEQEAIFASLSMEEKRIAYNLLLEEYSDCEYNAGIDAFITAKNLYLGEN